MTTRRSFIRILPLGLAGAASLPLMVACGDKSPPPAPPAPPPLPPAAEPMPAATTPMPEASAAASVSPAPASSSGTPDAASAPSAAGSTAMVSPQDPAAIALGYVAVASTVDAAKYTKYAPGQNCANCALFQGKAGDADGACPLFGGRHVAAAGWCSAHVNKT